MKYFVKAKLSENISETPEGYLVCLGVPICRTGEQVYGANETPLEPGPNGTVTIMREEAEVFRPETLASFEGKPVTITHPEEFVNPSNWKELSVGTMHNIRRGEGDYLDSTLADLLVTDQMAIGLVKNGLREVSCGYEADYEQDEPGYGYQKNIIGNHLAMVDQGRAGSSYAINDHKGVNKMTLKERLKKLKAKFADAEKEMQDAMEEMKDADGEQTPQDPSSGKPAMAKDEEMYDELKKSCDALAKQIDALMGAKDADEEKPAPKKKDKEDAPADDEDMEDDDMMDDDEPASMESRMKKLEAAVAKLLESKAGDEDMESEDADEEMEDDDFDESSMVGDSAGGSDIASRAEILAPGIEITKNVKQKALKAAYATKDGRQIIKSLSGGKEPAWDKKEKIDSLFIAASEVMKATRVNDNAKTKRAAGVRDSSGKDGAGRVVTADDLNAINAKHFGLK